MKFEWDDRKNKINIKKHGIDFVDVPKMFDHPMLVNLDTRKEYGEDRWIGIGIMRYTATVVVFTEREGEVVRIISARKATKYEQERYEKEVSH